MSHKASDPYRYKVITDPVHGEIALSQLEVALIDTSSFQRLRNLKQLGLASFVYPTATHTRFAHSLGVFHVMSRAIDLMVRRECFDKDEQRLLRIAALLHDIGHYPYSHLVEFLDNDPGSRVFLGEEAEGQAGPPYPKHEKLGGLIITCRQDISSILTREGIEPAEVAAIIRGQHAKDRYNQLVHSTLDLDRMDYLVRDALATGVPFGRIDLFYLLNSLDVDDEQRIVLNRKAATAAEQFVVARYFMSKAVYFHKTVFGFEALLRKILSLLRQAGRLWADGAAIEEIVLDDKQFLDFHDGIIDQKVRKHADKEPEGSALGKLCRALRSRRPPSLLAEVASLTLNPGEPSAQYTRFLANRKSGLERLAAKVGIPKECWLYEDPKDILFERLGPFTRLSEAATITEEESDELIHIVGDDGKTRRLVEDPTSIVHHLAKLRFQMARLYVIEENETKVSNAREAVRKWLDP